MKKRKLKCKNIVVIGDTHCGSSVGLNPPRVLLDDGLEVVARGHSRIIWNYWQDFWKWVYQRLDGQPFVLVHNGDAVDNRHHHSLQLLAGSLATQKDIAQTVLEPHVKKAEAFYMIRGTPAHSGESAELEESLAKSLGAVPERGSYTRNELWVQLGKEVIHFAHHIPTSGSHAYKSSPAMRLMAQAFADAGEWGLRPPTMMVRSHVHDYIEVKRPNCRVVVCPCWQGKTGFIWKKDTITQPVLGGLLIRLGDEGVHVRERVYRLPRAKVVRV
jgi:hypothetical protein